MSAKHLIYCLTDNIRMAKIVRPIMTQSIFARYKDNPRQQSQFQTSYTLYMWFSYILWSVSNLQISRQMHKHTSSYITHCYWFNHKPILLNSKGTHSSIFSICSSYQSQATKWFILQYCNLPPIQFNLQTFIDCSYIVGTCRGC